MAGRDPVTAPHLDQALLDAGGVPAGVLVPRYDRRRLSVGVVHLGVGGFHRAHQAVYLDDLMAKGLGSEWAICGVGVLPSDRRMAEAMWAQHGLTPCHPEVRGRAQRARDRRDDRVPLRARRPGGRGRRMADAEVRIVSLTVTEGGYGLDCSPASSTSRHRPCKPTFAPTLRRDDVRVGHRGVASPPGSRHSAVRGPVLRHVEHNGDVARRCIRGTPPRPIRRSPAGSMSRCRSRTPWSIASRRQPPRPIAPTSPNGTGSSIEWPVFCELFTQWVLEDVVPAQLRPPLEEVGVQLAADVTTYEAMKLRLLNAGHQAVGYLGILAGHLFVHDACADQPLAQFLRAYLEEAMPTLSPVPGIDLADYRNEVALRFANPGIGDRLNGSARSAPTGCPSSCCPPCSTTSAPAARRAAAPSS